MANSKIIFPLRQIVQHDMPVSLPKCMYKLKNLQSANGHSAVSGHVSEATEKLTIPEQVNQFLQSYQNTSNMTALENHQEKILQQLAELKLQMLEIKKTLQSKGSSSDTCSEQVVDLLSHSVISSVPNIIVNSSTSSPPYSLLFIHKLWKNKINLRVNIHIHSSVSNMTEEAKALTKELQNLKMIDSLPTITIRLIWKDVGADTELKINHVQILGEVNFLRYLSRLTKCHSIDNEDLVKMLEVNSVLDLCHLLNRSGSNSERNSLQEKLVKKLGKSDWFGDNSSFSFVDVAVLSSIKRLPSSEINSKLNVWLKKCLKMLM